MATRFENAYVLSVMADDHPGIVSTVCAAIDRLGGNIDSCSQTVLSGYFTLIMIVSTPEPVTHEALSQEVVGPEPQHTGFQVAVRSFVPPSLDADAAPVERFVITAFGQDKPGIVRRFSQYLAEKDINIIDLYGGPKGDDFVLVSQVEIPARWEITMLQADLEEMGKEEGFTVRLQHENVFVATNQLRLTR